MSCTLCKLSPTFTLCLPATAEVLSLYHHQSLTIRQRNTPSWYTAKCSGWEIQIQKFWVEGRRSWHLDAGTGLSWEVASMKATWVSKYFNNFYRNPTMLVRNNTAFRNTLELWRLIKSHFVSVYYFCGCINFELCKRWFRKIFRSTSS